MNEETVANEVIDTETINTAQNLEAFNRILKLRSAILTVSANAEKAVLAKPDNVSEVAWMAAHLGDIFRACQSALTDDEAAAKGEA